MLGHMVLGSGDGSINACRVFLCVAAPNFAVFALAKDERTVWFLAIRATNAWIFLPCNQIVAPGAGQRFVVTFSYLSSLYRPPRPTKAFSYSFVASSDVIGGCLEIMSLNMSSAFRGLVLTSAVASDAEGAADGAMVLMLPGLQRVMQI